VITIPPPPHSSFEAGVRCHFLQCSAFRINFSICLFFDYCSEDCSIFVLQVCTWYSKWYTDGTCSATGGRDHQWGSPLPPRSCHPPYNGGVKKTKVSKLRKKPDFLYMDILPYGCKIDLTHKQKALHQGNDKVMIYIGNLKDNRNRNCNSKSFT
jgi:hypothetical protein